MNILVVGCGKVGSKVASDLSRMGHDVSVVDRSEKRFALLDEDFSGLTVCGVPIDQDVLKPEFAAIVSCHSKYLRDRPSARITLEGNADERGTREYNMGLGERRGNAVSSAMQANGGSAGQLGVVSYGEERPMCTDSSESCWGQNRRVEIVYTAK